MYYLLLIIPVLIVAGFIYAIRKQSRVTAAFAAPEPDVDLTYRPQAPPEEPKVAPPSPPRDPSLAKLSAEGLVMEVLRECYDPEIPLNIVDLGLVYSVTAGGDATKIQMSLTAPGCPSGHEITQDVRAKLEEAGFPHPEVELVWEPPWTAERISPEGRKSLGI